MDDFELMFTSFCNILLYVSVQKQCASAGGPSTLSAVVSRRNQDIFCEGFADVSAAKSDTNLLTYLYRRNQDIFCGGFRIEPICLRDNIS